MERHSSPHLSVLMALGLLLLPYGATAQQHAAIESGLVGHWTFDKADMKWASATAGVAYDRSGNNNHGTLVGMSRATSVTVGKFGQALIFNGSTNYIMNLRPHLPGTDAAITISAWLRTSTTAGTRNAVVLNNSPVGGGATNAVQLSIRNSTFRVTEAGGRRLIDSGIVPNPNTWYLVTFTFDGTTNRIFVNGIEKANNRNVHQSGASSSFWVGTFNGKQELWAGSIDDVRIYNRALAADEVGRLFTLASSQ